MITIKFPQHMRDWIAQSKGELSPAKFLFKIIEAHYYNTISYKENKIESNSDSTGAKPIHETVVCTACGRQGNKP